MKGKTDWMANRVLKMRFYKYNIHIFIKQHTLQILNIAFK